MKRGLCGLIGAGIPGALIAVAPPYAAAVLAALALSLVILAIEDGGIPAGILPAKAALPGLALEGAERRIELKDELFRLLERFSPEFRERHIEAPHTGNLAAVRFHRTLLDEHFRVEGRRTWFETIGEMQAVLDDYLAGPPKPQPKQKEKAEPRKPDKQSSA